MTYKIIKISPSALLVILLLMTSTIYAQISENDKLVGSWILENVNRENCSDDSFAGLVEMGCSNDSCYKMEFYNNGSFSFTSKEEGKESTESGSYTVSGELLEQCPVNQSKENCLTVKLAVSDNILTLTSSGEEDSGCDIVLTYRKI